MKAACECGLFNFDVTMSCLYISDASQREALIKREREYNLYDNAPISVDDSHSGHYDTIVNYQTPRSRACKRNFILCF